MVSREAFVWLSFCGEYSVNFSGFAVIGVAALAYPVLKFAFAKLRDAAWREINIMRRLMPPRPGNREGRCLFD